MMRETTRGKQIDRVMEKSLPIERTSGQTWWRFSLRELLLLTLAIGAMLGWATTLFLARFQPTPFYGTEESWQEDVRAIHEGLGGTDFSKAWINHVRRNASNGDSRTMFFRIPLSREKRTLLLDALEDRVMEKLKAAGCRIGGVSFGSGNKRSRVILYRRGPNDGGFEAWLREINDDSVDLIIHMHEERGRQVIAVE